MAIDDSNAMTGDQKIKVLVTAFACNPNQGSEPGIGWGWVVSLAKVCQLTVLTTSCNRQGIEEAQKDGYCKNAEFLYLDVMPWSARLNRKGRGKVGVMVRLVLWQYQVKKRLGKLARSREFDIFHHLTLGAFRMPFSVTGHGVVSVVGPVGGCEEFPEHLLPESAPRIRRKEIFRNWMNRLHTRYGVEMSRYQAVDLTLSCTKEMSQAFGKFGVVSPVFPNIGMPGEAHESVVQTKKTNPAMRDGRLRLLFVGNLLYWKGLELALLAMQKLPKNVSFSIIGGGADKDALGADIGRLGLHGRVELLGSVPRHELLEMYGDYDLFFFPSLHDSGAMCVIEAMRAGLPVVCLDAGGPGISVTSECGRVVSLGPKMDVVEQLSQAVMYYVDRPDALSRDGIAASLRVREAYNWDTNAHRMVDLYRETLKK